MNDTRAKANAVNALASTGPRTLEGKARSAKNATKHGLLSREVLLADESKKKLDALSSRLVEQLAPVGELELLLVERIVGAVWRLRRVLRVEVELTERERWQTNYDTREQEDRGASQSWRMHGGAERFATLNRYESALERSLYQALHALGRAQESRLGAGALERTVGFVP